VIAQDFIDTIIIRVFLLSTKEIVFSITKFAFRWISAMDSEVILSEHLFQSAYSF